MLIQLAPGRSPGFFGSDHPAAGEWQPGDPRDVSDDVAAVLLVLEGFEHLAAGEWQPGLAREVSDEAAAVLLALEGFEHIHDESCVHPADEATENHEEGL